MAFDVTNPAHLLALKNEVNLDPLARGYLATGNTNEILKLLNDPALNVSGETGPAPVTGRELLKKIFTENINTGNQFKLQLLFESSNSIDDDMSEFKTDVIALESGLAAKIAEIIRPLSRVEVLFAVDDVNGVREFVTLSKSDYIAARDS